MDRERVGRDQTEVCLVERDVYDLARRFLARQERALKGLEAAVRKRDFARVRSMGHDLKGSGGAYGLDALSRLGTQLEVAADAADVDGIGRLLQQLEERLSRVELRVTSDPPESTTRGSAATTPGT